MHKKVHKGEITNGAGEKFTTVVQIGIGGSDLGPRAMYLALENWAKKNNAFKMEARFISNVDPDDAAAVLYGIDVAHSIFILVSKSGTTLETLTNESFVKDALSREGLDPSKHMIAVTSETSPLAKSDDYLAAFFMDDYIGGRYSSTSAVGGAVLSLAFGPEVFSQFLEGAAAEDKTALNEDVLENPAMLDALIGVYERNVLKYPSTAVLPYSQALSRFPGPPAAVGYGVQRQVRKPFRTAGRLCDRSADFRRTGNKRPAFFLSASPSGNRYCSASVYWLQT